MELAVADPRGTARKAQLTMLSIAGKTGTAEVAARTDHAWFAGYAPAESPRIAFVVVVENGGSGGAVAAPIASQFIQKMLSLGYLQTSS